MDLENAIRQRHSVRRYTDEKIEGETLERLKTIIEEAKQKSELNIELVLNEENAFGKSHYGYIKNCKNYIVIMRNKREKNIEEKVGYYGEEIVLKAQELGLKTCWVALTYNKNEVPCKIKDNEKIYIVIATGYGVHEGRPHNGKEFKDVTKTIDNLPEWYKKGIELALLAPTAVNQQKFKFELKDSNKVSLKSVGIGPCIKIDLGIVKYHFEIGAGKDNFEWC